MLKYLFFSHSSQFITSRHFAWLLASVQRDIERVWSRVIVSEVTTQNLSCVTHTNAGWNHNGRRQYEREMKKSMFRVIHIHFELHQQFGHLNVLQIYQFIYFSESINRHYISWGNSIVIFAPRNSGASLNLRSSRFVRFGFGCRFLPMRLNHLPNCMLSVLSPSLKVFSSPASFAYFFLRISLWSSDRPLKLSMANCQSISVFPERILRRNCWK